MFIVLQYYRNETFSPKDKDNYNIIMMYVINQLFLKLFSKKSEMRHRNIALLSFILHQR